MNGDLQSRLERCDAEIRSIHERADVVGGTAKAFLVTMGLEDWEMEKRLILQESQRRAAAA